jgi:cbb3-type cytochrome oxidase subunit 3
MNSRDKEFIQQQTWMQTVVSQHSIHATLAGLEVNGLILFASFNNGSIIGIQKILFLITLFLICVSVWCIVWMVNHERKEAYNNSQVTNYERELENITRAILNNSNKLSFLFISLLLASKILL